MIGTGNDPQPLDDAASGDDGSPASAAAKVARLRAAIAAGRYVVDPDAVAAALLAAGALTKD